MCARSKLARHKTTHTLRIRRWRSKLGVCLFKRDELLQIGVKLRIANKRVVKCVIAPRVIGKQPAKLRYTKRSHCCVSINRRLLLRHIQLGHVWLQLRGLRVRCGLCRRLRVRELRRLLSLLSLLGLRRRFPCYRRSLRLLQQLKQRIVCFLVWLSVCHKSSLTLLPFLGARPSYLLCAATPAHKTKGVLV